MKRREIDDKRKAEANKVLDRRHKRFYSCKKKRTMLFQIASLWCSCLSSNAIFMVKTYAKSTVHYSGDINHHLDTSHRPSSE